jgi:N4-gp56 family major capsid protein
LSIQNFIPEVWDAAIMEALYESHIFAQPAVVNRNYEGAIRSQGDTVHITGIEPVTIDDYSRYQDITFEEIDLNTRTMYIDQAKYFALAIDDIDKWQQKGDTMGPAMKEAGYKMSLAVDLFIANKMASGVDSANILTDVDASGESDVAGQAVREAFVDLRTRLNRNNVPQQGRWAIVSPEIYAVLLKDPHFIKANERGSASVVEGNGVVGTMYGFTIMESNNAPSNGTTHTLLAGNNTAFSYAEALTEVEAVRFEKSFGDGIKGLHVYGGKLIRPEGLVRLDVTGLGVAATPVTFRDDDWVEGSQDASRFPRVTNPSHTNPKLGAGEVDADSDDVTDAYVSSLRLTPRTGNTVAVAGTRQLTATATLSDSSKSDVSASATWESSATGVATVDSDGTVTGVAAGTAQITAYEGGKSDSLTVTVTA